jgi:DNA-binding IclR family transcriptional regulator
VPAVASPAASRAAQVLKVLAAADERELPLSELARRVGVNRASCQTLLLALVDEGLVVRREPGPTYRLGPAMIHLGEAARTSLDAVGTARPALAALRDRFGVTAMAGVVAGREIVVAAVCDAPHPMGLTVVTGGRVALRAPVGPIYVAWSSDAVIDAWLRRAEPPLGRARAAQARRGLSDVRRRGYSVTVRGGRRARGALDHEELGDMRSTEATQRVVGISAAAWDATGALACSLALTGFPDDLTPAEIARVGEAVHESAAGVSTMLGGAPPANGGGR